MTRDELTIGVGGVRLVRGETRRTIARDAILGLDRDGERTMLACLAGNTDRSTVSPLVVACLSLDDLPSADVDALEAWILDPSPGALVSVASLQPSVPTPNPAMTIGVGSVVIYGGNYYQITRPGHTVDGIVMWRLNKGVGQVPERELRLATPIRPGDIVQTLHDDDGSWWQIVNLIQVENGFAWALYHGDTGRSMTCFDDNITSAKRMVNGESVTVRGP